MSWMSWLIPRDKEILNTLETQSANLLKAAESLLGLVNNYENIEEKGNFIKELEHNGDIIARNIFSTLEKTFITPLDREDISLLAASIDNILDSTDGAADRFVLFKIKKPTQYMINMTNIIQLSANNVHQLITKLRKIKDTTEIIAHCRNIGQYENDVDHIYRKAIAELFESTDPIEIMKMKEVYDALEKATDMCVDVSDIIENIVLKYK